MATIFETANSLTAEDVVLARADLEALQSAIKELPKRRREIFAASRLALEPHAAIAKRHGVTVRTVEMEIKSALEHCAFRIERTGKR